MRFKEINKIYESVGDKPIDPAPAMEFVSNKFYIKFTPTGIEFSRNGELVYTKSGNYSNPTRLDYNTAKSISAKLWNKEQDKKIKEGLRDPKDNPCWKGYKPVGTKKKAGRTVPNCVPKESVEEATGDPSFDSMMKRVTKAPTAKERNAERIRQKRERQADSRQRAAAVFGSSPADKLSIRKTPGVAEASMGSLMAADKIKKDKADSARRAEQGNAEIDARKSAEFKKRQERDAAWWKAQDDAGKAGKDTFDFDGKTYPLRGKGVAEGRAGVDDTDTVGFSVNSEAAYTAVMQRFGHLIDHDETSGIMYAPARVWPQIEMTAFDADPDEGAVRVDDDMMEDAEQYYVIVHKVTKKPLSTHRDIESAKDEWRGLDQDQRPFYAVMATKKKPDDWSIKAESKKDSESDELNPINRFELKKIRARHPQARSDFDALIADLNDGQRRDRSDIGRLDAENDQEELDINRLDTENDRDDSRLDRLEQELEAIKRLIK